MGPNGRSDFKRNESISFMIETHQAETGYWSAIVGNCGAESAWNTCRRPRRSLDRSWWRRCGIVFGLTWVGSPPSGWSRFGSKWPRRRGAARHFGQFEMHHNSPVANATRRGKLGQKLGDLLFSGMLRADASGSATVNRRHLP